LEFPVRSLEKIRKLLKKQGLLFLMVPNANTLLRQIAVKTGILNHPSDALSGEASKGICGLKT